MKVSDIKARRVFTVQGLRPIHSYNYATGAKKLTATLTTEDYVIQQHAGSQRSFLKVTDRNNQCRLYFSASRDFNIQKLKLR